jgi:hypothetical protein
MVFVSCCTENKLCCFGKYLFSFIWAFEGRSLRNMNHSVSVQELSPLPLTDYQRLFLQFLDRSPFQRFRTHLVDEMDDLARLNVCLFSYRHFLDKFVFRTDGNIGPCFRFGYEDRIRQPFDDLSVNQMRNILIEIILTR